MGIAALAALKLEAPSRVAMGVAPMVGAPDVTLSVEVDQNVLVALTTGVAEAGGVLRAMVVVIAAEADGGGKTVAARAATGMVAIVRGAAGATTEKSARETGDGAGRSGAPAKALARAAVVKVRAVMGMMIDETSAATGVMIEGPAEISLIIETVRVRLVGMRTRGFATTVVDPAMSVGVRGISVVSSRMSVGVHGNRAATSPITVAHRGMTSVGTETLGPPTGVEVVGTTEMIVASAKEVDAMTAVVHVTTGSSLEIVAVGVARGTTAASAVMIASRNALFRRALSGAKTNRRCLK